MRRYSMLFALREIFQRRGILVIAHSPLGGAPTSTVADRKEMGGPREDTYV